MKKNRVLIGILLPAMLLLSGCSLLSDLLSFLPGGKDNKDQGGTEETGAVSPYKVPEVLCTYFHYFKAGPETYDQWWFPGKDPRETLGPDQWRRNIWIGRQGDYPYIGIYNNMSDAEIMRWHIRLAKASGISAFLLYMNDWQNEREQTELLLNIAHEEHFKIGFVEHHSFLGARSIRYLDGRPQPILPEKYVGYDQIMDSHIEHLGLAPSAEYARYLHFTPRASRDVPPDALNRAFERISGMLQQWKFHPAYLRVDGKPLMVIPYMVEALTPEEFKHLLAMITEEVGESLYTVAIVADVYWYFYPPAVSKTGITKAWSDTGANAFTHWTPNGMVTASPSLRLKAAKFHVKDSLKWKKDPMIPIMPGFDDDAWRPGDDPAPTSPRLNGQAWSAQLDSILKARPRFIFVQGWNEWHEGSQIEPSTQYSDPYLYLKILAGKLQKPWQTPPLPLKSSIDPLRLPYLRY